MKNLKTLSIIGMECDIVILDEKGNNISECWVIKEIPSKISELKNLEYLNLSFNSIKSIPKDIQQLKQLKVLDLTDNSGLENIENILLPDNLEELYLYGCFLSRLPDNLTKLKRLKKLGLTGNNLTETEINRIKLELPNCEISF